MALKTTASKGEGKDFVLPKAGNRLATLVAVIDLGIHPSSFNGVDNGLRRKIVFVWEFAQKVPKDASAFIAKEYLFSGDEKAALRLALQSWRGKNYRDGEELDPVEGLGKGWQITIVHQQSKTNPDRTYAKITTVAALGEGTKEPTPSVEPFSFDAESDEDYPNPEWMPKLYGQEIGDLIRLGRGNTTEERQPAGGSSDVDSPF